MAYALRAENMKIQALSGFDFIPFNDFSFYDGMLDTYEGFLKEKIADCIALQEKIGLDVLIHGEYERNDIVGYFGEHLDRYLFMEKRCAVTVRGASSRPWLGRYIAVCALEQIKNEYDMTFVTNGGTAVAGMHISVIEQPRYYAYLGR